MAKYNWKILAKEYVTGGDELTLEVMSKKENHPSIQSLLRVCAKERWVEQREMYRQRQAQNQAVRDNIKRLDTEVSVHIEDTQTQINKLVDEVEMLTRHLNIIRLMMVKGVKGIEAIDPTTLRPSEALSYAKTALELERLTQGLATEKVDIQSVSDEDLEKLAYGG